jgi:hypothetical protein
MSGAEPEERSTGISRGKDEPDDAQRARPSGDQAGASTEYAANAEPGGSGRGYVEGGEEAPTAADVDPHEPPGQG